MHDRDALLPREDQRRFLEADGWVAYAGPAVADLLKQTDIDKKDPKAVAEAFVQDNGLA